MRQQTKVVDIVRRIASLIYTGSVPDTGHITRRTDKRWTKTTMNWRPLQRDLEGDHQRDGQTKSILSWHKSLDTVAVDTNRMKKKNYRISRSYNGISWTLFIFSRERKKKKKQAGFFTPRDRATWNSD